MNSWPPQGHYIQQLPPPQIDDLRNHAQYPPDVPLSVSTYTQPSPDYQSVQNSFLQTNGSPYQTSQPPAPSPLLEVGNPNATVNGTSEYVDASLRTTECINGTYTGQESDCVLQPPSTPNSGCNSVQSLENNGNNSVVPVISLSKTPTTANNYIQPIDMPSQVLNQENAMPGYPPQQPPQLQQSILNSNGYPGQNNQSATHRLMGEEIKSNIHAPSNEKLMPKEWSLQQENARKTPTSGRSELSGTKDVIMYSPAAHETVDILHGIGVCGGNDRAKVNRKLKTMIMSKQHSQPTQLHLNQKPLSSPTAQQNRHSSSESQFLQPQPPQSYSNQQPLFLPAAQQNCHPSSESQFSESQLPHPNQNPIPSPTIQHNHHTESESQFTQPQLPQHYPNQKLLVSPTAQQNCQLSSESQFSQSQLPHPKQNLLSSSTTQQIHHSGSESQFTQPQSPQPYPNQKPLVSPTAQQNCHPSLESQFSQSQLPHPNQNLLSSSTAQQNHHSGSESQFSRHQPSQSYPNQQPLFLPTAQQNCYPGSESQFSQSQLPYPNQSPLPSPTAQQNHPSSSESQFTQPQPIQSYPNQKPLISPTAQHNCHPSLDSQFSQSQQPHLDQNLHSSPTAQQNHINHSESQFLQPPPPQLYPNQQPLFSPTTQQNRHPNSESQFSQSQPPYPNQNPLSSPTAQQNYHSSSESQSSQPQQSQPYPNQKPLLMVTTQQNCHSGSESQLLLPHPDPKPLILPIAQPNCNSSSESQFSQPQPPPIHQHGPQLCSPIPPPTSPVQAPSYYTPPNTASSLQISSQDFQLDSQNPVTPHSWEPSSQLQQTEHIKQQPQHQEQFQQQMQQQHQIQQQMQQQMQQQIQQQQQQIQQQQQQIMQFQQQLQQLLQQQKPDQLNFTNQLPLQQQSSQQQLKPSPQQFHQQPDNQQRPDNQQQQPSPQFQQQQNCQIQQTQNNNENYDTSTKSFDKNKCNQSGSEKISDIHNPAQNFTSQQQQLVSHQFHQQQYHHVQQMKNKNENSNVNVKSFNENPNSHSGSEKNSIINSQAQNFTSQQQQFVNHQFQQQQYHQVQQTKNNENSNVNMKSYKENPNSQSASEKNATVKSPAQNFTSPQQQLVSHQFQQQQYHQVQQMKNKNENSNVNLKNFNENPNSHSSSEKNSDNNSRMGNLASQQQQPSHQFQQQQYHQVQQTQNKNEISNTNAKNFYENQNSQGASEKNLNANCLTKNLAGQQQQLTPQFQQQQYHQIQQTQNKNEISNTNAKNFCENPINQSVSEKNSNSNSSTQNLARQQQPFIPQLQQQQYCQMQQKQNKNENSDKNVKSFFANQNNPSGSGRNSDTNSRTQNLTSQQSQLNHPFQPQQCHQVQQKQNKKENSNLNVKSFYEYKNSRSSSEKNSNASNLASQQQQLGPQFQQQQYHQVQQIQNKKENCNTNVKSFQNSHSDSGKNSNANNLTQNLASHQQQPSHQIQLQQYHQVQQTQIKKENSNTNIKSSQNSRSDSEKNFNANNLTQNLTSQQQSGHQFQQQQYHQVQRTRNKIENSDTNAKSFCQNDSQNSLEKKSDVNRLPQNLPSQQQQLSHQFQQQQYHQIQPMQNKNENFNMNAKSQSSSEKNSNANSLTQNIASQQPQLSYEFHLQQYYKNQQLQNKNDNSNVKAKSLYENQNNQTGCEKNSNSNSSTPFLTNQQPQLGHQFQQQQYHLAQQAQGKNKNSDMNVVSLYPNPNSQKGSEKILNASSQMQNIAGHPLQLSAKQFLETFCSKQLMDDNSSAQSHHPSNSVAEVGGFWHLPPQPSDKIKKKRGRPGKTDSALGSDKPLHGSQPSPTLKISAVFSVPHSNQISSSPAPKKLVSSSCVQTDDCFDDISTNGGSNQDNIKTPVNLVSPPPIVDLQNCIIIDADVSPPGLSGNLPNNFEPNGATASSPSSHPFSMKSKTSVTPPPIVDLQNCIIIDAEVSPPRQSGDLPNNFEPNGATACSPSFHPFSMKLKSEVPECQPYKKKDTLGSLEPNSATACPPSSHPFSIKSKTSVMPPPIVDLQNCIIIDADVSPPRQSGDLPNNFELNGATACPPSFHPFSMKSKSAIPECQPYKKKDTLGSLEPNGATACPPIFHPFSIKSKSEISECKPYKNKDALDGLNGVARKAVLDSLIKYKHNDGKSEIPECDCVPPEKLFLEPGSYYTHLGAAANLTDLRNDLERRIGFKGSAIRIEKIVYTGKEGKTPQGCPMAKWIIRRASLEEKILVMVKHREGHKCRSAWIVVVLVAWEGVVQDEADLLYNLLTHKLNKFGVPTLRRCMTNDARTCACQGLDPEICGASFSFGCSWSMYYNGCKYARCRGAARKFRLSVQTEEQEMEDRMNELVTNLTPLYEKLVPEAYKSMTLNENLAPECRLGNKPGRPFSGVTACVDFCSHSHRDLNNMNDGLTMVVTLTKHRGLSKAEDEQLHVLPLYTVDETDEFGDRDNQMKKSKDGAIEVLTKYEKEVRVRSVPMVSSRRLNKKRIIGEKQIIKKKRIIKEKRIIEEVDGVKRKRKYTKRTPRLVPFSKPSVTISPTSLGFDRIDSRLQSSHISSTVFDGPHSLRLCSPDTVTNRSPASVVFPAVNGSPDWPKTAPEGFTPRSNIDNHNGGGTTLNQQNYYSSPPTALPRSQFTYSTPPARSLIQTPITPFLSHSSPGSSPKTNFSSGTTTPISNRSTPLYVPNGSLNGGSGGVNFSPSAASDWPPSNGSAGDSAASKDLWGTSTPNLPAADVRRVPPYSTGVTRLPIPQQSPHLQSPSVDSLYSPSNFDGFAKPQPSPKKKSDLVVIRKMKRDLMPDLNRCVKPPPVGIPLASANSGFVSQPVSLTSSVTIESVNLSDAFTIKEVSESFLNGVTAASAVAIAPFTLAPQLVYVSAWPGLSDIVQPDSSNCSPSIIPITLLSSLPFDHSPPPAPVSIPVAVQPLSSLGSVVSDISTAQLDLCTLWESSEFDEPSVQPTDNLCYPNSPLAGVSNSPQSPKTDAQNSMTSPFLPASVPPVSVPYQKPEPIGEVVDIIDNKEAFEDSQMGGIGIALGHGSVLFECAKLELHSSTALRKPDRSHPSRISLVFYQHRNLLRPQHGGGDWEEKMRRKKFLGSGSLGTSTPSSTNIICEPTITL